MLTLPRIVRRRTTPYAAVARDVRIPFGKDIGKAMPAVEKWLAAKGASHGPAIFRYNRIAMPELGMEFGFLLPRKLTGDEAVTVGTLPAGAYATMTYRGHYRGLMEATTVLLGWIKFKGLATDSRRSSRGELFTSRFELYPNGPQDEPDPDKWETQLYVKLRD